MSRDRYLKKQSDLLLMQTHRYVSLDNEHTHTLELGALHHGDVLLSPAGRSTVHVTKAFFLS
jgi:hypothetical protein